MAYYGLFEWDSGVPGSLTDSLKLTLISTAGMADLAVPFGLFGQLPQTPRHFDCCFHLVVSALC